MSSDLTKLLFKAFLLQFSLLASPLYTFSLPLWLSHLFFFSALFYLLLLLLTLFCCTQLDLFANYNLNCHMAISRFATLCFLWPLELVGAAAYGMKTFKVGSFHLDHNSLHTFGRPLNN